MRGKLRDKRAAVKSETLKRDLQEKRRISKRDTRLQILLDQQLEENENYELDGDSNNEETLVNTTPKK
jgi:hypothetical protein